MIVRPGEDSLVLVRQADHARHVGELAARLIEAPAGDAAAFVAAARLHDNGWREADAEPLLDRERGFPHTYRNMPPAQYREIWGRGIDRAVAVDPHVGLLVSLHGMQFFERKTAREDQAFHARERDREDALLREMGLKGTWQELPGEVQAQYEWMRFLDGVSLYALDQWTGPWYATVGERVFEVVREGEAIRIDPFPFREAVVLEVPARALPVPRYEDAAQLVEDYQEAEGVTLTTWYTPAGVDEEPKRAPNALRAGC